MSVTLVIPVETAETLFLLFSSPSSSIPVYSVRLGEMYGINSVFIMDASGRRGRDQELSKKRFRRDARKLHSVVIDTGDHLYRSRPFSPFCLTLLLPTVVVT